MLRSPRWHKASSNAKTLKTTMIAARRARRTERTIDGDSDERTKTERRKLSRAANGKDNSVQVTRKGCAHSISEGSIPTT